MPRHSFTTALYFPGPTQRLPFALILAASLGTSTVLGSVRLLVRDGFLPDVPVLVRVELRNADGSLATDVWDAEATLVADGAGATVHPDRIFLRNGVGSLLVEIVAAGDVSITASVSGAGSHSRQLTNLTGATVTTVSGTLGGTETEWSGIVRVTGDVTVPAGHTLRVLPGTLVLVDGVASGTGGKDIDVEGVIESLGTEDRPVTFTASDPATPWGELDHDNSGAIYRYTHITRAGHSPGGGHTGTGPAVRLRGSAHGRFEYCSITDNAGKVLQTTDPSGANLEFLESLLARCVMGPEIAGTQLIFEKSYIMEMFGGNDGDDGDAIYVHDQRAGQSIVIRGAIVADTTDDGIDTLGSEVMIEDTIVRDMSCDKGISVFGGEVTVRRSLIVDNDKGISAKSSDGSTVNVEHVTFAGNRWSIESRLKSNAQSPENHYLITNSIIRHNGAEDGSEGCESNEPVGGRTLRTDFPLEDPDGTPYIEIHYSDLQDGFQVEGRFHETWPGAGSNNIAWDPMFVNDSKHDFHLQEVSPCIDSGDPGAPADPDGTRTDMGVFYFAQTTGGAPRFRRGDVNADGAHDVSDAIRLLLYLFIGTPLSCKDAGDVNDDGSSGDKAAPDVSDAVYLLDYLFRGGPAPPPPVDRCGEDPTDDGIGCETPPCP